MLSVSYDENERLAVWHFSGTTNSDADYELYCTSIKELNQQLGGPRDRTRIAILTLDSENPVPNAAWRKRIAEATANIRPNTLFILASERALVRGVMTAINWVRPLTYEAHAVPTFAAALALVAKVRPDAIARLEELHAECLENGRAATTA